jgi:hypothetical protein
MKKTILSLTVAIGVLFIGNNLIANNNDIKELEKTSKVKKPPIVDEAQQNRPKEDSTKGAEKKEDKLNDTNVSLSTIKDVYKISRKGLNKPPYRCYIYHADKSSSEIGVINSSTILFTINKSQLVVGDTIVVTNSEDTDNKEFPKFIVEWIEVKK